MPARRARAFNNVRDILLGLYDTISVSISIRDILLWLYDKISDSISIRDILLDLYDTISDGLNKYSRYPIVIIW